MTASIKKISFAIVLQLIFSPTLVFSSNTTFAPLSCEGLNSTDLSTHLAHEIDSRIEGLTANDSTKKLWTARGNSEGGWTRSGTAWIFQGDNLVDMSGLSPWNSYNSYLMAGTLITPKHIAYANHFIIQNGSTVTFVASDGTLVNRTTVSRARVADTDIHISLLDSEVPENVTHYPVLDSAELINKIDPSVEIPFVVFDQEDKAIIKKVNSQYRDWDYGLNHSSSTIPSRAQFNEVLVGGDSGDAGFLIIDGKPVLILTHTGPDGGPHYTHYRDEINTVLANLGGEYELSNYDLSCFDDVPNIAPVIFDETISVNEKLTGSGYPPVYFIKNYGFYADPEDDDYSIEILSGNVEDIFFTENNQLKVAKVGLFDYERYQNFILNMRATDTGEPAAARDFSLTINLNNLEDDVDVYDQDVWVDETTARNESVGFVGYNMSDNLLAGNSFLTFAFIGGYGADYFSIDSETGEIFVDSDDFLNIDDEYANDATLTVGLRVDELDSDTEENIITEYAVITFRFRNVPNENAPEISVDDSSIEISESLSDTNAVLVTVSGTDEDGNQLGYSIIEGNDDSTFAMSSSTGELKLLNPGNLNYSTKPSYSLIVKAYELYTDEEYFSTTTISVNLTNDAEEVVVVETPRRRSSSGGGGGGGGSKKTTETVANAITTTAVPTTNVYYTPTTPVNNFSLPAIPAGFGAKDLEMGASGSDVVALQRLLISLGYDIPAGPTGFFWTQSKNALSRYQLDNGIFPSAGYFGPRTRTHMKNAGLIGLWW